MAPGESEHNPQSRPQLPLVLATVFIAFLAQMTLNPIIAPLAREVGLAEWQIGVTVSSAALMIVATSQFWGRISTSWGRRPVLVASLLIGTVAMALFALSAYLGVTGVLAGGGLFAAFVASRGLAFGVAVAAIPPTAQAYIANITSDPQARVRGMAGMGAVQGMSMVGGAVLGGTLSAFGLLVPVIVVPILLAGCLAVVSLRLREQPQSELIANPPRVSPFDHRVRPFLIAGFGMFTALGFIMIATGFVVQDRLGFSGEVTGLVTGAALVAAGGGMVAAQTLIVPRFGWGPVALMRVGAPVAAVGFVLLALDGGAALLVAAMFVIGFGLGIAVPGYVAGPSLRVSHEEQGGLAGLVNATNGLTFVIAPTAGTALYGVAPLAPVLVGGAIMALIAGYMFLAPTFRSRPPLPSVA